MAESRKFVLGLVLGRLAENYLFLSTARYGGDFMTRPFVIVLVALSVFSIFLPVLQSRLERRLEETSKVKLGMAEDDA